MAIDKDRVEGSANQTKGRITEAAGKLTGDEKLKSQGRADQTKGKLQNIFGSIKDALRGKRS